MPRDAGKPTSGCSAGATGDVGICPGRICSLFIPALCAFLSNKGVFPHSRQYSLIGITLSSPAQLNVFRQGMKLVCLFDTKAWFGVVCFLEAGYGLRGFGGVTAAPKPTATPPVTAAAVARHDYGVFMNDTLMFVGKGTLQG